MGRVDGAGQQSDGSGTGRIHRAGVSQRSRGVGFKLANHYSSMAENMAFFLPKQMRKLGYLDYKRGEGQEYEVAMTLAGDFARA